MLSSQYKSFGSLAIVMLLAVTALFAMNLSVSEAEASSAPELPHFSFGVNDYGVVEWEFKTPEDNEFLPGDRLEFILLGHLPPELLLGDASGYIRGIAMSKDIQVYKVEDGVESIMPTTNSSCYVRDIDSPNNVNDGDSNTAIITLLASFDENVLEPDSTYRIRIHSDIANQLLSAIIHYTYVTSENSQNARLTLINTHVDDPSQGYESVGASWIQVANESVNQETIPKVKEFNSSNNFSIAGSQIRMHLGDMERYDEIERIALVIEGKDKLVFPEVTFSLNGETLDSNLTHRAEMYGNIHTFDIPIAGIDFASEKNLLTITSSENFRQFRDSLTYYFGNNRYDGNVFLVAYDHTDKIVGYKKYSSYNTELLIEPKFEFDYSQDNPLFGRLIEMDGGGYSTISHDLFLRNTGEMNANQVLLEGVTTTATGEEYPFLLTLAGRPANGDFMDNFRFEPFNSPWVTPFPDEIDIEAYKYEDRNEVVRYREIPIHPGMKNTIQLTFTNQDGDYAEHVFDWYPNSQYDIFDHARLEQRRIGPNSETLKLDFYRLYGSLDQINGELYYLDTSGDTLKEVTVATISEVVDRYDYTVKHSDDHGKEWYENKTFLTFNIDKNIRFAELENEDRLRVKIHYQGNFSEDLEKAKLDFTYYLNNDIRFDTQPPRPYVNFFGMETVENSDFYVFSLQFNNEIYLETITNDNFKVVDIHGNDMKLTPAIIKGYRNSGDNRGDSQPFNDVHLYFEEFKKNSYLEISELVNVAGNRMTEPLKSYLSINTFIDSYLKDSNLDIVSNKRLRLFLLETLPDVVTGEGPEKAYTRDILSDANGKIHSSLHPGVYKLLNIWDADDYSSVRENHDFIIEIPMAIGNQAYTQDIILPQKNVQGNIHREVEYNLKEELVFIPSEYADIYHHLYSFIGSTEYHELDNEEQDFYRNQWNTIRMFHFKRAMTELDGSFTMRLNPGSYELIGKNVDGSIIKAPQRYVFDVGSNEGTYYFNDIVLEQPNVFITLYDYRDKPLKNVRVDVFNDSRSFGTTGYANENGSFGIDIPEDGTYNIVYVYSGHSAETGSLYNLSEETTFAFEATADETKVLEFTLPAPNVSVSLTIDGENLGIGNSSYLIFDNIGGIRSNSGEYLAYFPVGTHAVYGYDHKYGYEHELNQEFTIVDSGSMVNVEVDMSHHFNSYVHVLDVDIPIPGVYVNLYDNTNRWHSGYTNEAGKVYFNIDTNRSDSGIVRLTIDGYTLNDRWNNIENQIYEITETPTWQNRDVYELQIISPNFRGSVVDEDGNKLFSSGWIDIGRVTATGSLQRQSYWIDNNGDFTASLEAGNYQVMRAGSGTERVDIHYSFKIAEVDGRLRALTMDDELIAMPVTLVRERPNFYGYLYRADNSPYVTDGSRIHMKLKEAGVDEENYNRYPWLYETWVEVSGEDGSFEMNLNDAKKYEVIAVSTENGYFQFAKPVEVTLGQQNIIRPPAYTFGGVVQDYYDNPATGGSVWLDDGTEPFWVRIYHDGTFGKNLEEGNIYHLTNVYYNLPGERYSSRLTYNEDIVIGENTSYMLLQPNVKGEFPLANLLDLGMDINHIGISIIPEYNLEDFSGDQSAYNNYLRYPWQYEIWSNMKVVENAEGNSRAVFYTYLPDGKYSVRGVNVNNSFIRMDLPFVLDGNTGSSSNVTANNNKYIVQIDYNPNVIGQITEDEKSVKDAWVQFVRLNDAWTRNYDADDIWFGTNSNAAGMFSLDLPEGFYRLESYRHRGNWEGTQWLNGAEIPVGTEFQIDANGNMHDRIGNPIARLNIEPTVSGELYVLDNNNNYVARDNAWFSIYKVNEDGSINWNDALRGRTKANSNSIAMMLPEGKYVAREINYANGWTRVEVPFAIDSEGKLVNVPDAFIDQDLLLIRPMIPNFTGVAYLDQNQTTPAQWGWITVLPFDAASNDWSQARSISTNRNGQFHANLPDGEWNVVEFGARGNWNRVTVPFTVADGVVTSSMSIFMNANGTFTLFPPQPNVVGTVEDREGNVLTDNAWVAIKPQAAGEHNWEDATWVEYKQTTTGQWKFGTLMAPGEYKVVQVSSSTTSYSTNIPFIVTSYEEVKNVEVQPLSPNVTGLAYEGEQVNYSNVIEQGWIHFARVDEDGQQLDLAGNNLADGQQNSEISWEYTVSTEIEAGNFQVYLQAGTYMVVAVSGSDVWYQPNQKFTVEETEHVVLEITQPAANVTIEVKNIPANLRQANEGWLSVYNIKDNERIYVEMKFVNKNEAGSFIFEGRLPDGDYHVDYFGTPRGGIDVEEQIVIGGVTNVVIDLSAETNEEVALVNGVLTIAGQAVTERTWIAIESSDQVEATTIRRKIQTDENGEFTVRLHKGTTWKLVEVVTSNGYRQLDEGSQEQLVVPVASTVEWELDIK